MRIAILGATSQIAKDLILSFAAASNHDLILFARRPHVVRQWLANNSLSDRYIVFDFESFGSENNFDVILNCVGVGNPAQALVMGASIFDVTLKYDEIALDYLYRHPTCRYLFLSSGAAYGASFESVVDEGSLATFEINNFQAQECYAVAKLHAECRHRALSHLPIIDIRVFSYFSHTMDISARFFITDILRAIQSNETLITSNDNIFRDYIGPQDFYQLINLIIAADPLNDVFDCYTLAPVSKMALLSNFAEQFGLVHEIINAQVGVNATGLKMNYFSKNRRAEERLGYSPSNTSLNTILNESQMMLDHFKNGSTN